MEQLALSITDRFSRFSESIRKICHRCIFRADMTNAKHYTQSRLRSKDDDMSKDSWHIFDSSREDVKTKKAKRKITEMSNQ